MEDCPTCLKTKAKNDTRESGNRKARDMDLREGPRRSFATDDPLIVSSSVLWVEEEKEDMGTLILRNQRYAGPIIEKELEWAVKTRGALKGEKGGSNNRDTGRRRHGDLKEALPIALNTWSNDPILMGKIGNTQTQSKDFEEAQWEITSSRSLQTGRG